MPTPAMQQRGGVTRWRTVTLPDGRYIRVAVVPKAGERGGHTISSGTVHDKATG